jgi:iron complex outermembrane receptor protein
VLTILIFNGLQAQQDAPCKLQLSGTVTDSSGSELLSYASIFVKDHPELSTQSNAEGKYLIRNICPGNYVFIISHLNCERISDTVNIQSSTVHNFILPHHEHEGPTVVITDKAENPTVTVPRTELSGRTLDRLRGYSLGEAVATISGVNMLQSGNGIAKPMIHGMHSNRLLILNKGVRQEGQQWGVEHAPEVDPYIASRITVIKGASAVRYGSDAIAGVILLDPRDIADTAGLKGELNLVGFTNNRQGDVSGSVDYVPARKPELGMRIQGTLRRGGNYTTPEYRLKNTGIREQNFSTEIRWKEKHFTADFFYSQFNTDIGIFSGSHIGNITDLYIAFQRDRPADSAGFTYEIARPYQHVEHELARVKLQYSKGEYWRFYTSFSRQYNLRQEYDKHGPLNDSLAALNRPELQYEITSYIGEIVAEHNMYRRFNGSMGAQFAKQGNTYEGRFFIPNYRSYTASGWLIERWMGDSILIAEAGLRYDYRHLQSFMWQNNTIVSPELNFSNVAANLGVIIRVNENAQITSGLSRAWRAPTVNELYSNGLHHGAAAVELGKTDLTKEVSWNGTLSFSYHKHDQIEAEVSLYSHLFNGFIYLRPSLPPSVTIQGAFPTFRYDQTNATISGMDYSFRGYINKKMSARVNGAFIRGRNTRDDEWLFYMPSDRITGEMRYETLIGEKFKDVYFELSYTYVNRQFRVPAAADYTQPPKAYGLLGCSAGAEIYIGGNPVLFNISATNILNTSYREYLNRFRYYADEAGTNIRLHVKIPFTIQKSKK